MEELVEVAPPKITNQKGTAAAGGESFFALHPPFNFMAEGE